MRSRELTRGSSTSSGRFCSRYEHDGAEYDVCDSALNAILINELFEDEALEPSEKEQLLPRMLFPDAEAALAKSGCSGRVRGMVLLGAAWASSLVRPGYRPTGVGETPDERR